MTTFSQPGVQDAIYRLRDNVRRVFLGSAAAVDQVICCLLARGHVLIEDVPGVGKTVLATALARSLDCRFSRIQFTPDLLPGDVLGVSVYDRNTGTFELKPGPIFANIVLADEINRTTPRTQSALLEAMNEASVSIEGKALELDQPFMVVATQNPHEYEGAYPLPESQLDRFLMRVSLGYPSAEDEARILQQRPGAPRTAAPARSGAAGSEDVQIGALRRLQPVLSREDVLSLQARVDQVRVDPSLVDYIIRFVSATRGHPDLTIGVSPRGALALAAAARSTAVLRGRDYCVPEDILGNIVPVCAHRVATRGHQYNGRADAARRTIQSIIEYLESPA